MKAKYIKVILCVSLALSYLALYNGYPLVTSDSGAYINNGHQLHIPGDRLITYSLFLRAAALDLSLWLPIFIQNILLAILFYRCSKVFLPSRLLSPITYALMGLAITTLTWVSWYSNQLMPDIFTAVLALGSMLYHLDRFKHSRVIYLGLILVSCLMHSAHLLVLLFASGAVVLHSYVRARQRLRASLAMLATAFTALLIVASINLFDGSGFTLSTTSHVFLMGKLCENGMLKEYLDDHCPDEAYGLCQYKDNLPEVGWSFVWDQHSPLNKMGGWEATKTEYSAIIKDMALSPRYYPLLAYKSVIHTLRQMTQIQVGDGLFPFKEQTNPYWKVQQHYRHELPAYMQSAQNRSALNWDLHTRYYWITLIISTLLTLYFIHKYGITPELQYAYALVILFIVMNAFVTANLANVLARLSSRIVWLIPMLNIIYIIRHLLTRLDQVKQPS